MMLVAFPYPLEHMTHTCGAASGPPLCLSRRIVRGFSVTRPVCTRKRMGIPARRWRDARSSPPSDTTTPAAESSRNVPAILRHLDLHELPSTDPSVLSG